MYYELTVPQYSKTLKNLSAILTKGAQFADAKKFEVSVLLNSRLAPDQFDLTKQVQIACDTAKFSVARLTGKEAPAHADTEKTLAELKTRIDSVVSWLATIKKTDFQGAEERKVTNKWWDGKWMPGSDYVVQHAIPNFYFHVTTAYSILRNNGVDIGKGDYLGELPLR
jgi:hypothetical protein